MQIIQPTLYERNTIAKYTSSNFFSIAKDDPMKPTSAKSQRKQSKTDQFLGQYLGCSKSTQVHKKVKQPKRKDVFPADKVNMHQKYINRIIEEASKADRTTR